MQWRKWRSPGILCQRPKARTGTRMASLSVPSRPQGRMRRRHDQVRTNMANCGRPACDSGHVLHEVKTRGSKSGDSCQDGDPKGLIPITFHAQRGRDSPKANYQDGYPKVQHPCVCCRSLTFHTPRSSNDSPPRPMPRDCLHF